MLWSRELIPSLRSFSLNWSEQRKRKQGSTDALCMVRRVYGHAVLVLLGTGVCAGVTLRKSYAADAGWMVVTTGWALGVLCGVLVAQAFGSPGAHLNPAITLSAAVSSGNYSQVLYYWSAQLLGAMCGAALMTLHYGPHWKLTPDPPTSSASSARTARCTTLRQTLSAKLSARWCWWWWPARSFRTEVSMTGRRQAWDRGWLAAWCGASASRWAALRVTPSTRRATWARGSSMRYCPFRQGRVELALCVGSHCGRSHRRRARRPAAALRASLIERSPSCSGLARSCMLL